MRYRAKLARCVAIGRATVPRRRTGLTLLSLAGALSGCGFLDDLVGVDAPSRIVATTFETPGNAAVLLAGAIGDFQCALAHYIVAGGLVGEEFQLSGGGATWTPYDQRTMQAAGGILGAYAENTCDASNSNQRSPGVYRTLSTAQYQANHLRELLEGWTDAEVTNRASLIASAAAYAGYATALMGEAMCSAAFDLGPEMTPAQVFARADQRFTEALAAAQASNNTTMRNLALVGRARTRLNLGRKADAAADAASVPAGFALNATYSSVSLRRENTAYVNNVRDGFVTVGDFYRDVRFQNVSDPRARAIDTGRQSVEFQGPAGRIWVTAKYSAANSPITVAKYEEAQLIVAENHVALGNLQGAVTIINQLHAATSPALPPFSSSDPTEIMNQIVYERRAALFAESHHFADLRRYQLPLRPPAGTQYPTSGSYGNLRCFPLPDLERLNNPNLGAPE